MICGSLSWLRFYEENRVGDLNKKIDEMRQEESKVDTSESFLVINCHHHDGLKRHKTFVYLLLITKLEKRPFLKLKLTAFGH